MHNFYNCGTLWDKVFPYNFLIEGYIHYVMYEHALLWTAVVLQLTDAALYSGIRQLHVLKY